MSQRNSQHDTFTIERSYPVAPARVFDAFADQTKKAKWFGCVEGWKVAEHTVDFRIGGREVWRGGPPGGTQHRNDTVYHDIVPNERIVWSYTMRLGDRPISVSLTTLELHPDGTGTRMRFVEQGVFLDDYDGAADRVRGTKDLLDSLERALRAGD
jgi:uncharacterized protein YndB with AHSA1/START domain